MATSKTSRRANDDAKPRAILPAGTKTPRPTKARPASTVGTSAGDFNLRTLVRDVATRSTLLGPTEIADEVMRRIPDDKTADALGQALRVFVRQVLSEERPHSSRRGPAIASPGSNGLRSPRSSKVAGIRDGWQKHLRAQYFVGDGHWQRLGECTRDNLVFIAGELDRQAARHAATARGMRGLAEALTENKVERVKDLPAELLMHALGAAA